MDNTLFGVSEWFVICHHEMADFLVTFDIGVGVALVRWFLLLEIQIEYILGILKTLL